MMIMMMDISGAQREVARSRDATLPHSGLGRKRQLVAFFPIKTADRRSGVAFGLSMCESSSGHIKVREAC